MEKIASFCIDHTKIVPGVYISRTDGDIVTYDIRAVKPNTSPFLQPAEAHTIEHIFATFARNSQFGSNIVYFGPMGCLTGFYLLTRKLSHEVAVDLIKDAFNFIVNFQGEIPGCSAQECGNYRSHDLLGAKLLAKKMCDILKDNTQNSLEYPQ